MQAIYNVTDTNGDIVLKGERAALSLHKELSESSNSEEAFSTEACPLTPGIAISGPDHVKLITLRSSLSFTGKTTGVVGLDSSGAIVLDVHMDSGGLLPRAWDLQSLTHLASLRHSRPRCPLHWFRDA